MGKKNKGSVKAGKDGEKSRLVDSPKVSSTTKREKARTSKKSSSSSSWSNVLGITVAVVLGMFAIIAATRWLAKPSLTRPLSFQKVIDGYMTNQLEYSKRLWGSYRSNVYFGMRPRLPRSLIAGLVWVKHSSGRVPVQIRHMCEHGDGLDRYGWMKHDGVSFGEQEIIDGNVIVKTDFLVNSNPEVGDSWTARISAEPRSGTAATPVSLIFYLYNEGSEELKYSSDTETREVNEVFGNIQQIGDFQVKFSSSKSPNSVYGYLATRLPSIISFTEFLKYLFKQGNFRFPGEAYLEDMERKANLVAYQVSGVLPLEVEISFMSGSDRNLLRVEGDDFTRILRKKATEFDERFEDTFSLKSKGFSEEEISFAKAAFSNLIGGISYFHGSSLVMAEGLKEPLDYFPAALYTGVPSRSFFPRGFLWDEGFHQLLVTKWDINIAKDVLGHWLDLLNSDGWIPREQILGQEARSKVPNEFVIQHNTNANPPTLFLTFESLLNKMEEEESMDLEYLKRVYPRLLVWFNWFDRSQVGPQPTTFRWRGRNSTTDRELNPKTLASGLDDYPRASHPSDAEYHLDLRCWMTLALRVLYRIAEYQYTGDDSSKLKEYYDKLADIRRLNILHWDESRQVYSDFGNHTSSVKLAMNRDINPPVKIRKTKKPPKLRFIDSFGYVNLFPLLMQLIPPNSPQLGYTLQHLRNESLLWTEYGLRSLAKLDPFYSKSNTDQDKPYWRGDIWININYLTVRALHHYGNQEGPYKEKAMELYTQLRSNLISNIFKQYKSTGYIWEHYHDRTGAGKGTHPFTGWSSLVVLIMAEQY